MPEIIRVHKAPRDEQSVPSNATLVILPMTLDRVGKEIETEDEQPVKVDSVESAFHHFRPSIRFETIIGERATKIIVELEFDTIEDFTPENIRQRLPNRHNDLAEIENTLYRLYRLSDSWRLPRVRRACKYPEQRQMLLNKIVRPQREDKPDQTVDQVEETTRQAPDLSKSLDEIFTREDLKLYLDSVLFAELPERLKVDDRLADLVDNTRSMLSELQKSSYWLADLVDRRSLLSEADTYEQILRKIQERIDVFEAIRDDLLARLYEQLRPIESSYRQIQSFYENSVVSDGKERPPVELFVFNADTKAIKNEKSMTMEAIRQFIKSRNSNGNFRDDIHNLVVPGPIPIAVRQALEEESWKWGMLLITDLDDEINFEDLELQFRPGGRYEFLKRWESKAAYDVVLIGYLKFRDRYWFENDAASGESLYGPASVIFAGALARTDRTRDRSIMGPIGTRFGHIKGVEKARLECLISQIEIQAKPMQLIVMIRDADNLLCFYGCRCTTDDHYGVYKIFTAYRVLAFIQRLVANHLREVAGQVLTLEFINEEIEKPISRILDDQKGQGTIIHYALNVDKCSSKRMQGICDIFLEVMPMASSEVFKVKLDVPEFGIMAKH